MTPLPTAGDAPESLLWPTAPERSHLEPRVTGDIEVPSRSISENTELTNSLITSSSRSVSRHRQLSRERGSFHEARTTSPINITAPRDNLREVILASFAPRVAILASEDTDQIAEEKGFPGGFYTLLRPFSEHVSGKVVVRDSNGASKAWENFSVRLIQYGEDPQAVTRTREAQPQQQHDSQIPGDSGSYPSLPLAADEGRDPIDTILELSLPSPRMRTYDGINDDSEKVGETQPPENPSSAYVLYLRKLLSTAPLVPYETFTHPVACIIAVSSRSQGPLEKIRQLYSVSGRANARIPPWVGVDYLRYYVLVHDEDRDDVTRSTALFDLMKRHFGLHCYLLRIRSVHCTEIDDDCFRMPQCLWRPAAEEQVDIESSGHNSGSSGSEFIFESDATAIKNFIREMVTQSLVPYMESRIVSWNDQIASKRRGISGRFMSLSKKWTGFGSSKGSNPATTTGSNSTGSNYDAARGYYLPEAPEAIMRQLADYAFMLKDFRLAFSTYETLRTDFSNDKAWLYHASASGLAGISYLLIPQTLSNRSRSEMVDQKLDAALYSYLTRCSTPPGAVRTLIVTIELLIGRGSAAADDAVKWAIRLLDLAVLTPLQQALITERIADFQQFHGEAGVLGLGSRSRQRALWNMLSSILWVKLGKPQQASFRLGEARKMMDFSNAPEAFTTMGPLFTYLAQEVQGTKDETLQQLGPAAMGSEEDCTVYETNERFHRHITPVVSDNADSGGFSTVDANHPAFDTVR